MMHTTFIRARHLLLSRDAAAKGVQCAAISLLYSNPWLYITPTNTQHQMFTTTLRYTTPRRQIGTPPLCWRRSFPGGMCQGVGLIRGLQPLHSPAARAMKTVPDKTGCLCELRAAELQPLHSVDLPYCRELDLETLLAVELPWEPDVSLVRLAELSLVP
jgi:hypothetical protein